VSGWFDEMADDLDPAERERLRRVDELLVAAGPPPELPADFATLPGGVAAARTVPFLRPRRRAVAAITVAAALAAAAFGGGYLVGDRGHGPAAVEPVRVVAMSGQNARASLRVGAPDAGGNWPLEFSVTGLPKQTGKYAYYEIFVLRDGKPGYPCGGFRVRSGTTTVSFLVPYAVESSTRWVVTSVNREHQWPGRIVMT
jgi:hypothetical protein